MTKGDLFPTLEPAITVFKDPQFLEALINTTVFVAIGTPIELIMGLFTAMLIYNSYWGKTALRSLFVIPFALPGLVIATLLFILFDSQGGFANHLLQGEYWLFPKVLDHDIGWRGSKFVALSVSMLGKVWRDMPISMLIILSGLNSIDPQLLDAAKTMGAGFRIRFYRIILPLIFPAITTVLLLRSVEMWKEFIFPYILAGSHPLLGTFIEELYGFGSEPAEAAVVALVLVACTVLTLMFILGVTSWVKKRLINPGVHA
jgi:ABC-type sugar transport system permease subunit